MSTAWANGSTTAWRRLRAFVLARDGYTCQLRIEGVCTTKAEHVHHLDGAANGIIVPPDRLVASCAACNLKVGDPEKFRTSGGGTPAVPVTPQPGTVMQAEIRHEDDCPAVTDTLTAAIERWIA